MNKQTLLTLIMTCMSMSLSLTPNGFASTQNISTDADLASINHDHQTPSDFWDHQPGHHCPPGHNHPVPGYPPGPGYPGAPGYFVCYARSWRGYTYEGRANYRNYAQNAALTSCYQSGAGQCQLTYCTPW